MPVDETLALRRLPPLQRDDTRKHLSPSRLKEISVKLSTCYVHFGRSESVGTIKNNKTLCNPAVKYLFHLPFHYFATATEKSCFCLREILV